MKKENKVFKNHQKFNCGFISKLGHVMDERVTFLLMPKNLPSRSRSKGQVVKVTKKITNHAIERKSR
jgi:hypothetical protein